MQVPIGVVGASGFTGGELVRLLLGHPMVDLAFLGGRSSAGRRLGEAQPHLAASAAGDLLIRPVEEASGLDFVFLALPRGDAAAVAPGLLEAATRVIDLGGDFRLAAEAYPAWYGFEHPAPAWLDKSVYGLTELFREQIRGAELVANPGCFPTPAILGLAPLLKAGVIEPDRILVDGKTGLSGAGRSGDDAMSYAATEESVRPYRFPAHQHTPELERALGEASSVSVAVSFVPHLVPAVRGVLTTAYARAAEGSTTGALVEVLAAAYEGEPFVHVLPAGAMADTKRVRGSNVVEVQAAVDPRTGTAVVVGAVDNLVKGAAGQAIQNLNLMVGAEETTALSSVGMYP
ncbi:MAG TPA: N-acetyl-gamma-glutamyl-phosphate reductase [Actinomycetota bacterium]|nr:N-acetyl-gamma-glutamyl-phosphate reductase [Actinomycetota bacterium]